VTGVRPVLALARALALCALLAAPAAAAPEGEMTWAIHVSLAPAWFDPAETPSVITPFMMLYALHDALVKPMPGNPAAPSLAESWSVSRDGLAYEFVLRKGVRFHNGDPVTAEDVKFSLERYRGGGAGTLKERVARVTCTPHVMVPAGWAAAGADHRTRGTSKNDSRAARKPRVMALPSDRAGELR